MEINQINDKNIHQQDIYKMISDLKNKYEILKQDQKRNEEQSNIHKTNILNLNRYLSELKNLVLETRNDYEKEIRDLKETVHKITKNINKKDNLDLSQINNINNKYNEISKEFQKRFEDIVKDLKEIKIRINIDNNHNNNDNNNNKNDNNIINNNQVDELKIDEKDNVFQKFEFLLTIIIQKNEIDNKNLEELKQLSEKLIINNVSPYEQAVKYFSDAYKYLHQDEIKEVENVININKKVFESIEQIETEIKEKINKMKKPEKKYTDKRVEKFRKNYGIKDEDATDKEIINLLNVYKNNEQNAYKVLIQNILNNNKK